MAHRSPVISLALAGLASLLLACQPQARAGQGSAAETDAKPATAPTSTTQPSSTRTLPPEPTPTPTPGKTPLTGPLLLAVGDTTPLGRGTLHLREIVNDSRCPKDAQCIWEGEVTLDFEWKGPDGAREFQLSQKRQPSVALDSMELQLTGFGPCAKGSGECATLAVHGATLR